MRITNLGNDIPYKLSNIVYNFDKFLTTYENYGVGEFLQTYKNYLDENGLEKLILTFGPESLLDSVLNEIFENGQWYEISESMDYKPSERNMLNIFFEDFVIHWKTQSEEYNKFFEELLQENLDDLIITEDDGSDVTDKALQFINTQQQVSDDIIGKTISGYDCIVGMKVQFDDINERGFMFKNSGYIQEIGEQGKQKYLLINGENGLEKIACVQGFKVLELPNNNSEDTVDERNVDAGTKLEIDSLIAMGHYHNVMLDTTDNAGEFIYNIIKDLNDSADELGYSEQEKFNLIKWGITGIVEDRLFTPSSDETDEMYDTPNYNITKEEFLDIFKSWVNHLDNIGLDFDVVDLVSEIYGIDYDENKFQITSLDIDNQLKINDYIEITFSFVTGINTKEYGEATVYPVLDDNSNIDYIKSKIEIISLDDDYFNEYNTDSDFKFELDNFIFDNVDLDLFPEDESFEIQVLNVSNEKLVSRGTKRSTFIHGDFDFNLVNDDMFYNGTFKCFNDKTVEIEEIYDENSMPVDKYDKYLEDIEKEISENVDLDLFNDDDFTITEFSLNNQELDEDNNYIVGTFSCNIGGEEENAEFRVWEEFSKDKKVLYVEINGLNEKNQIEYDKFDDFSVELDELIKIDINTDLWPQDDDDFENARLVEVNNIEVELVIEKLNSTKFPNPQVEFYYPYLNIESTEIVPKEKVIEFLNLLLNDDEFGGNFIVDDYTLKTLSPDYLSFNELLSKLMEILPETDFEDNEDVLYMVISNDLKIKLSVGAVIWNYLNDNFKR